MIAKHISAPKGGSGFKALSGYVLNVRQSQRGADPASWSRLNAYILDSAHDGEKVAWARVTNCQSEDPGWAVKEILATQARNTRTRKDKNYHLVVSFPEGEKPTREQIEAIEDRLCAAIGMGDHQRVSAVHQNTDNWHLHIAINRVHPQTFKVADPIRDHFRLQEACQALEAEHGLTRENHTLEPAQGKGRGNSRAADFEARQGASFLSWVKREAAPALLAARDAGQGWQAMHQAAAGYGLVVKLRGAGLVIGHASDARLHIKASDVDRGLSLKALTAALGAFEPAGQQAEATPAKVAYAKPARSGDLYAAFKAERQAALKSREQAIEALREKHRAYAAELRRYYGERLKAEKLAAPRGVLRRESFTHIIDKRQEDHKARIIREAEERKAVRAAHPIPGWQGWLEAKAAAGDLDALAALRGKERRAASIEASILTAASPQDAKAVVYRHLKPAVRRNGAVIYRVDDGGLVADEARHIRVAQPTAAATALALSLALDRFGGKPLVIGGSQEFREQVASLAGATGMAVTFADPALEQRRKAEIARNARDKAAVRAIESHRKKLLNHDQENER